MKDNYTHIAVVLDASGSMQAVRDDTIGGFNRFVKDQRELPGEATLSLTTFNTAMFPLHLFSAIENVPELDASSYIPSGMTALLDAVGQTIRTTGEQLAEMDESKRPSRVIFVIMTDGQENSSRQWTKEKLKELISQQKQTYSWEFVFLGANQDAFAEAGGIGIGAQQTMNYAANAKGTREAFASMSASVSRYRGGGDASFEDSDRQKQADAGASSS